jgi:hypothetical protein
VIGEELLIAAGPDEAEPGPRELGPHQEARDAVDEQEHEAHAEQQGAGRR